MPIIDIKLITGYSADARRRLSERITDATTSVIDAPADLVTVTINEINPDNYMRGRTGRQPGPAVPDQTRIVTDYLQAMEARDLERAKALQAEGFTMKFPGNAEFKSIDELLQWASQRYSSVAKKIVRFDECITQVSSVVYCHGTLYGTWLDGTAFEGVRFIDRFELQDNLIVEQLVWNDLAEVRANASAQSDS